MSEASSPWNTLIVPPGRTTRRASRSHLLGIFDVTGDGVQHDDVEIAVGELGVVRTSTA